VFSLIDSADRDITNSVNTIHELREKHLHEGIQTMKDADNAYKMFTIDVKKICNDLNIRHKDLITRTQTKVNQYKNEIKIMLSQLDKDDKSLFVKVINKVTKYVENTAKKLPNVKELYGEDFAKMDELLKNIDEIKSYKNRVEKLMERNEKTNKNSKIFYDDNVDYGKISDVFIKLKSLRDDFSKLEPALDQLFQNLNTKISELNLQEPPLEDNILQQYIENINNDNEGNLWENIELQDDDPMLKKYIVALEELKMQKKSIENATKKIETQEAKNKTLEDEKKAQEVENKKLEAKNKTQEEKLTELKEHLTTLFDCHHNPSEENNQHFKEVEVQIKNLLGVGLVNNDFLNDFLN
jgi:chromosome segregation ATPase